VYSPGLCKNHENYIGVVIMCDIKKLETEGVMLRNQIIFGSIAQTIGDNLGIHQIFGIQQKYWIFNWIFIKTLNRIVIDFGVIESTIFVMLAQKDLKYFSMNLILNYTIFNHTKSYLMKMFTKNVL
jgi:hypothetical protein